MLRRIATFLRGSVELAYGLAAWFIVYSDGAIPFTDIYLEGWALRVVHNVAEAGIGLFVFVIARRLSVPDRIFNLSGEDRQARSRWMLLSIAIIIAAAFLS